MRKFNIKTGLLFLSMALILPAMLQAQTPSNDVSVLNGLQFFWTKTGFANFQINNLILIVVGIVCIYLSIAKKWEPRFLLPIGFGIIVGNIPFTPGFQIGIHEPGSVLNMLYSGVSSAWYPSLLFLGIGAMTDFSALISNPKLMLLGAAAQLGIFVTFIGAYALGFTPAESGSVGLIGGLNGPAAIFLSAKLAPHLMGAVVIAVYSYMALTRVIQRPILKFLTTKNERLIRMKAPRQVSRIEKIIFPVLGFLLTSLIAPAALPLLGMLFLGNLLKESGVTEKIADTARSALMNTVIVLMGFTIGASIEADRFLTLNSVKIFILGALSIVIATATGILFAKIMNLFLKDENKINPLIGSAGVAAIPLSAKVSQEMGLRYDKTNYLLKHAMGPTVAGIIGSAVTAGLLLGMLS